MEWLRQRCIYYMCGVTALLMAAPVYGELVEKSDEVAAVQSQARQSAVYILSQAYQLSGMKEMTANLGRRYVGEALSRRLSGWVGESIAQVFAEHKGPTLSQKVNDPVMRAEMQTRIAARLREEIPGLVKAVVYDNLFQGMLSGADPGAQKMVAHIVDAMTRPLNAQVDVWAQQLYGKAMETINPYITRQLQIGHATIALSATDIRGTIDGAMRLQTVTDMISGPLADAMGESAFGEMQTRLTDFLHNKLPPELETALYKGPDAVDALIARGEEYLPTAQLNALKAKMLALPILTIPNEVYGGMLAGSAARHFVLAFAEFPVVNEYELQRGVEVTNVMVWQIKNKSGFNMSLGQLLDMANSALGQVGGLANLGRVGKTVAQAKDKFTEVEKKIKAVESEIKNPIEKVSKEFRAHVDELKQSLLDFQADIAAPLNDWISAVDTGLKEGGAQIKVLLGDFNGIPTDWEWLKKALKIPDKILGKYGDKSVLDNMGIVDAARRINGTVSNAMAEFLVDATQTLLPQPEIAPEEKVPAQNPDANGDYDPVFLHNGEFTHPVVDVAIPGRGLVFQFKRTYRSRSQFMGRLGWNWTHNFEEALRTWFSPEGPGLTWINDDGRKYFFKMHTDHLGEFVSPAGVFVELKTILRNGKKWFELRERGGFITRFDRTGLLQEKCDRFGNCLRCDRDASGTLQAIIDTVGRRTQLSYDKVGRLTKLTDNIGRVWMYDYDVRGDLVRVVSPATDVFPQGVATGYTYDAHRMTQIRDPNGNAFLKNVYGTTGFARGQIIGQSYGAPENIVKSRYVLLRPPWVVSHWPDVMNVVVDRVDLRGRRNVVKRFWHNANGNLLWHEIVDARGKTHPGMRYVYNEDGLRVKKIWPSGLIEEATYYSGSARMLQGLSTLKTMAPQCHPEAKPKDLNDESLCATTNDEIRRTSEYTYDPKFGDLVSERTPDGVTKKWQYDNKGNPLSLTLSQGERGIVTKYHHNTHGQLTAVEDPRGIVMNYAYDGANLTSIVRDARGRKVTTRYVYDGVGNITGITLPNGGVRSFDVDSQNLIRREITPLGYERRYDYDPHGNVTAMHVGDYVYQFSYDLLDQLIVKSEPRHAGPRIESGAGSDPASRSVDSRVRGNDVTRYSYDPDGRISEVTFPEGNRMRMTYDAWGHLTAVERGAGSRESNFIQYQYDADGNVVGVVDGLGHLTEMERNGFGETDAIIYPNLTRQKFEHDRAGREVGVTWRDSAGSLLAASKMERDVLGLSERQLQWDSQRSAWRETRREFDEFGNLISEITPTGSITRWDYDALGNLRRAAHPMGLSEEWDYNELALPIKYTSPMLGEVGRRPGEGATFFSYDLQSRLTARTDPNGAVTKFSYDDRDDLVQETPPEGAAIHYTYDGMGRRTAVAQAERVTRYDWDGNGRLRAITDPMGRATQYTYDAADRLTTEHYPDGGRVRRTYDANGLIAQHCLPNGRCVTQDYDVMGNVVSRQVRGLKQSFQYDALGRMVSAREGDGVSKFVYSSISNVVEYVQGQRRLKKTHDANGAVVGMQFPDGKSAQWQRDALGRIIQIDGPDGFHVAQTWGVHGPEKIQYVNGRVDTLAYDGMGNVKSVILSAAKDLKDQILRLSQDESLRMTYQYSLFGNLISQNSTPYTYDPWQQLVRAGNEQWRYNLNGERIQSVALQFDENGNMTSDGQTHYLYDVLDRLQEVQDENHKTIARYTYDALNRRIAKEVSGHTTQYVYDGWEPVEIYEDGQRSQQFIRGDGLDDAFGDVGPRYYHKDRMGSVIAVSDASGKIIEQTGYDSFGSPSPLGGEGWGEGLHQLPRRYTSQLFDAETGLYYMRNRYYSPQLGQFLTRDPLGYKNNFYERSALAQPFSFSFHNHLGAAPHASLTNQLGGVLIDTNMYRTRRVPHNTTGVETNLHMYVKNNPLMYKDPMGLYADVVVQGNNVTITIPIKYKGAGATPELVDAFNAGIQEYWSGDIGRYHVTTTVVPGSINQIHVPGHYENKASEVIMLLNRGTWYPTQEWELDKKTDNARWVAAHEAGHLMGLRDRYRKTQTGNVPDPGYETNIMGEYNQRPSATDIENIIRAQAANAAMSNSVDPASRGNNFHDRY